MVMSVVAISAVSACTVPFADRHPPSPSRPVKLPEPPTLDPASKVWPEAMFTLPARFGKESDVQPLAMLSKTEALMVTLDLRPQFLTYDRKTRRHRVLATAPKWSECGMCYEIKSVAVGDEQIVWTVGVYRSERWNPGKRHVELWAMPRSGGQMRLVTWLTGHYDYFPPRDRLSIDGDQVTWRSESVSYLIPLSSGKPQKIASAPSPYVERPDPDVRLMNCGVEWCAGEVTPDIYQLSTVVIQHRNGSGRTTLPAAGEGPLIHDRFGLFGLPYVHGTEVNFSVKDSGSSALLYDRCTARSAWVGVKHETEGSNAIGQGVSGREAPILFWRERGNRYTVLDLSRVSDRPCRS
ncbi:hypothetical protein [Streptosporangium sp. NBC_01469]|uniref:hypothetical protein n=1 Tax=Streptosporangium sp. NBC_01469 TaxID=2903898 RepID=UPI002E2B6D3A|nr:hypothetical protein [Streptosporangium sp. NBC_01469]